jgi:hypothetical protein
LAKGGVNRYDSLLPLIPEILRDIGIKTRETVAQERGFLNARSMTYWLLKNGVTSLQSRKYEALLPLIPDILCDLKTKTPEEVAKERGFRSAQCLTNWLTRNGQKRGKTSKYEAFVPLIPEILRKLKTQSRKEVAAEYEFPDSSCLTQWLNRNGRRPPNSKKKHGHYAHLVPLIPEILRNLKTKSRQDVARVYKFQSASALKLWLMRNGKRVPKPAIELRGGITPNRGRPLSLKTTVLLQKLKKQVGPAKFNEIVQEVSSELKSEGNS